jgi:hypothetical protein
MTVIWLSNMVLCVFLLSIIPPNAILLFVILALCHSAKSHFYAHHSAQ